MTNDVLAAVHGEDEVRSAIALMKHIFFLYMKFIVYMNN